jgi:hypothetical protein
MRVHVIAEVEVVRETSGPLEQLRATGIISMICEPNSFEMLREDL